MFETEDHPFSGSERIAAAPRNGSLLQNKYAFGEVQVAAEETDTDTTYYFKNPHPSAGRSLVIQLTITGAAAYRDANGERLIERDYAVLFSPDEAAANGGPAPSTKPFRKRTLEFSDCASLRVVFDRLRSDFGPVVSMPGHSAARGIFDEIMDRFRTGRTPDPYRESELLFRLLISIYRDQVEGTRATDPIEFGYHYIVNRFRHASNVKEIAAACGVTREYFARQFKERYGETPGELLKRLRIEHAQSLLAMTSMPVEEVASASGFSAANVFARSFRQHLGRTPGEFRADMREKKIRSRPA
jgi:AraC family transcriptional regulator of arabinose operon